MFPMDAHRNTADHLAVLWPINKGNGGTVNANEPLSVVMDKGQEVRLLLGESYLLPYL
jgi:hypothetical protein